MYDAFCIADDSIWGRKAHYALPSFFVVQLATSMRLLLLLTSCVGMHAGAFLVYVFAAGRRYSHVPGTLPAPSVPAGWLGQWQPCGLFFGVSA